MLPSAELQREAENEPARGPCGDNGPEGLPEVGYGPKIAKATVRADRACSYGAWMDLR